MGEHPGLARPGARDDEQRAALVQHGLALLRVQPDEQLFGVGARPVRRRAAVGAQPGGRGLRPGRHPGRVHQRRVGAGVGGGVHVRLVARFAEVEAVEEGAHVGVNPTWRRRPRPPAAPRRREGRPGPPPRSRPPVATRLEGCRSAHRRRGPAGGEVSRTTGRRTTLLSPAAVVGEQGRVGDDRVEGEPLGQAVARRHAHRHGGSDRDAVLRDGAVEADRLEGGDAGTHAGGVGGGLGRCGDEDAGAGGGDEGGGGDAGAGAHGFPPAGSSAGWPVGVHARCGTLSSLSKVVSGRQHRVATQVSAA